MHTSAAVAMVHACPHDPQLFGSNAMFTSQPFEATLSQSWKPVVQDATEHVDAAHDSTAFDVLHGVVQAPQWPGLVVRLTHAAPAPPPGGQSVGVAAAGHDWPQLVPSHVGTPFAGMGHWLHDAPHELVDVFCRHVATAPTAQLCVPAGQTQLPPWQTVPPEHATPHVPQLF